MSPRFPALATFLREHIVERGHFVLSSGAISDFYIDGKKATLDPEGMRLVGRAVWEAIAGHPVDAVAGLELGAVPMVCAAAAASPADAPVVGVMVRKVPKGHGLGKRLEGPVRPGMRVAVLEDVVTSGKSVVQCVEAVREAGCEVAVAVAMVDRDAGGKAAVEAVGVPYVALVTKDDLGL
jgi:orotate phosphoribosyltransferase